MKDGGVEQRLGMLIKRAEQALISAKTKALRPVGLTVPQYAALLMLHLRPGASAAELARLCLVTPQTMNTIVTNLEEKKLLERRAHPVHAHVLETMLTRHGRDVLAKADKLALAVEGRLGAAFRAGEREVFKDLLGRSVDALTDASKQGSHPSHSKRPGQRRTSRPLIRS